MYLLHRFKTSYESLQHFLSRENFLFPFRRAFVIFHPISLQKCALVFIVFHKHMPFADQNNGCGDDLDDVNNGTAPSVDLTCVAATDVDGQGACGAEGGRPAVHHQDRQEVHILLLAVKA